MTKGRLRFSVAGFHPQLLLVRDHLIQSGLVLLPWSEEADLYVVGVVPTGQTVPLAQLGAIIDSLGQKPTIVLSTGKLEDKEEALTVPFNGDYPPLFAALAECLIRKKLSKSVILRLFDIYGPDVHDGWIRAWITQAASGAPPQIPTHGYHSLAPLFQDDFLDLITLVVSRTMSGLQGTFAVGHDVSLSAKQVAGAVWRAAANVSKLPEYESCPVDLYYGLCGHADISPIASQTKWYPKTSLNQGIRHTLSPKGIV